MKKLHKLNLALHWIRIIFPIKKFILQNGEISPKGSYGLLWALQSFQHPKTHFCNCSIRTGRTHFPLRLKIFFKRMFGLWYLSEAYWQGEKNPAKNKLIWLNRAEQFTKMFQNCAFCAKRAILTHFHELLGPVRSDHFNFCWILFALPIRFWQIS